jgi:hypothetical protein
MKAFLAFFVRCILLRFKCDSNATSLVLVHHLQQYFSIIITCWQLCEQEKNDVSLILRKNMSKLL